MLRGKHHVSADDVAAVAGPILRHRLILNFTAQSEGITVDDVIRRIIQAVPKNQWPVAKRASQDKHDRRCN